MSDFIKLPVLRKTKELDELFETIQVFGGFVSGGYARWCASPNPGAMPRDLDVFVSSKDSENRIRLILQDRKYRNYFENENTYNFALPEYYDHIVAENKEVLFSEEFRKSFKVQLIKHNNSLDFSNLNKIINHFDFSVVRCGFESKESILADPDFIKDEKDRYLRIKHVHCPIGTMIRAMKYKVKGYTFESINIIKLMEFWEKNMDVNKKEQVSNDPNKMTDLYQLMMLD